MQRALIVVVLGACRMNFDPIAEDEDVEMAGAGSQTSSQPITAEPGSELAHDCMPGQPCMVDCSEASSCIVDCGGTSTCDVLCAPGACIVNRCTAPSCEVDCGLGQKTVINDTLFCSLE